MGSIKELLFDIQEEWRHEWISINYPEAEEETLEWDAATQEYSWFRDWMEEAAEQQHFEASLNCIPERLQEALDELHELQGLLETEQLIVSPNLLSELKNLSIQEGYMLKIENVLPPNFRVFLVREGFIFPGESWVCGSGYWLPESEVLKNGINSLLV
ncbi:hypothetical protein BL992_000027 [Shigella flexneri]|nr:hypothetical protein [Shigella flexneri]EFZ5378891.1 hypothetical protein [Shigella flexneri]